jgi:hypothetical protein
MMPAIEVMKILYMGGPLVPHLVSMFSRSHGPSRLQKLAFRTIRLQTGELSALLKLTPHLVELDIDVPPTGDLLKLSFGEGQGMLVPMLQALYIHTPGALTARTQTEHFDTLAEVRCELGTRKDSQDATMPSLPDGTWTALHTLRFIFDSAASRDILQKKLNNWSSSFTPEEAKTIDRITYYSNDIYRKTLFLEHSVYLSLVLDSLLSYVEHHEVTNKILHVGIFFWMLACGIFMLIFFKFFRR